MTSSVRRSAARRVILTPWYNARPGGPGSAAAAVQPDLETLRVELDVEREQLRDTRGRQLRTVLAGPAEEQLAHARAQARAALGRSVRRDGQRDQLVHLAPQRS